MPVTGGCELQMLTSSLTRTDTNPTPRRTSTVCVLCGLWWHVSRKQSPCPPSVGHCAADKR
eukprot:3222388-Prorocentrum_lima.AAC.1